MKKQLKEREREVRREITEKIANIESVFLSPLTERIWRRWTSPWICLASNQKLSAFREAKQEKEEGHNWNNGSQGSHWFHHTLKVLTTTTGRWGTRLGTVHSLIALRFGLGLGSDIDWFGPYEAVHECHVCYCLFK